MRRRGLWLRLEAWRWSVRPRRQDVLRLLHFWGVLRDFRGIKLAGYVGWHTGPLSQIAQELQLALGDHAPAVELVGDGTAPALPVRGEPLQLRNYAGGVLGDAHTDTSLAVAVGDELAGLQLEADEVAVVVYVLHHV